jgi:CRP-like cAMP-binding protein
MKDFIHFLNQKIEITGPDIEIIKNSLSFTAFVKGEAITKDQQIEKHIYFIESGIVRLFFERQDRDITFNFGFPHHFISAFSSFISQQPSKFCLQALTDVKAIALSKDRLDFIYKNTKCGLQIARVLYEETILYMSQRETDFMLLSPTERYLSLFERNTALLKQIPLKYLASYIGITPQALSRIRAKIN